VPGHGGAAIQLPLPPQPVRAAWWQPALLIHVAWVRRVRNEKQGADYECDSCCPFRFTHAGCPLLICSGRPCGVGGGRRFSIIHSLFLCDWEEMLGVKTTNLSMIFSLKFSLKNNYRKNLIAQFICNFYLENL